MRFITVVLLFAATALAQQTKPTAVPGLAGRPDVVGEELLGGTFQNPTAGIAFRVPHNCQPSPKSGDEIARFASADKSWEMIVDKSSTSTPLPLSDEKKLGLLEVIAARLKQSNPATNIVRQDTVNLGENEAGIIIARYTVGSKTTLFQEAIIQANDQLYYTIALSTPAAKDAKAADGNDAGEQVAVETFRQLLDTVKLLDRTGIKNDQNERLYRTRALFTNLTQSKLRSAIIPEQWLRLIHDGKDIGYTYIVEEAAAEGPNEGIKVGTRSRSFPEKDAQVDGETWCFISFDRRHETWRNQAWIQNSARSDHPIGGPSARSTGRCRWAMRRTPSSRPW
jgi:hypothetical protein